MAAAGASSESASAALTAGRNIVRRNVDRRPTLDEIQELQGAGAAKDGAPNIECLMEEYDDLRAMRASGTIYSHPSADREGKK